MYLADCHVHSTFSFDGKMSPQKIAQLASENGIKYVAFTEHLDLCRYSFDGYLFMLPQYNECVKRLNDIYDGKIRFLTAGEFAEPHIYRKELEKIQKLRFDFIVGSIHFIDGKSIAFKEFGEDDPREITDKYYHEVYNAVDYGGFDAFAHFDHIRRGVGGDYSEKEYVADIMKRMVENNIALEVNTSGIRRTKAAPFPDLDKVKAYIKEGGNNITIGSDTHRINEFYDKIEDIYNELKKLNLSFGVFIDRKFKSIV